MDNPTFTDMIKYYCQNPYKDFDYATYVDKHKVKAFVKGIVNVAEEYAYFTTPKEIDDYDFGVLPNKFAIKATHSCGQNILIEDGFNKEKTVIKMKKWLKERYAVGSEKQYSQVTPGVLIEQYIDMRNRDYRFHMFWGKLEWIRVNTGIPPNRNENFYYKDWTLTPFRRNVRSKENVSGEMFNKPIRLKEMVAVAQTLAEKIGQPPYVRVDFFVSGDNVLFFSEYTFTPSGGNHPLEPVEYGLKYGALLNK